MAEKDGAEIHGARAAKAKDMASHGIKEVGTRAARAKETKAGAKARAIPKERIL